MPNIKPKTREELAELEDVFERAEAALGFVPTSFFMMGRKPSILRAFSRLSREVLGVPGSVPPALKWLVAHVASRSAGCRYCTAHTGTTAALRHGVPPEKVAAAFEYETNPMFTGAERAALRFAQAAGSQPNMVGRADFDALLEHFDEDAIVEIMAVVSLFGWLNRWNDTMATALEEEPRGFAEQHLAPTGWTVGRHADGD
ncbi:MAG: carboxymuconolactone decarboxylase family protein [Alphaproteobacteria bacterium]|jgi:uncharacterized peroxidase-related enzyme|nr:carboxymuconolactone decarboxylase family protein [Alphaproteobacteria bacterium]MDP6568008.1 carboxymuconolactone decarboxylase family protein [Alphaproteobacteria bacterium]MDP6814387.1 carboxymuconolactone decarboxylase family protein [Alphaproteobacteria bacterium]